MTTFVDQAPSARETTARGAPQAPGEGRIAHPLHLLMCRPTHFDVTYSINAWMDPGVPVDRARAMRQWEGLVRALRGLGHTVELCDGAPGLPDMVFAANAATVVGGTAMMTRFAGPERAGEVPIFAEWLGSHGLRVASPTTLVNEGEGDVLQAGPELLAGSGFRTDPRAHAEIAAVLGLPVVSLELVDPAFYHLDTAMTVLAAGTVAYYPGAFSADSRRVLAEHFPETIEVPRADAGVFGLNAISDGRNVVIPVQATGFAARLRSAGFEPVTVDISEFAKAGGGAKCCVLTLRG